MTRRQVRFTLKRHFAWWGKARTRKVLRLTQKNDVLCGMYSGYFSHDGMG